MPSAGNLVGALDITMEPGDHIEVEIQRRSTLVSGEVEERKVLYIHLNGITVARICRIEELEIKSS